MLLLLNSSNWTWATIVGQLKTDTLSGEKGLIQTQSVIDGNQRELVKDFGNTDTAISWENEEEEVIGTGTNG